MARILLFPSKPRVRRGIHWCTGGFHAFDARHPRQTASGNPTVLGAGSQVWRGRDGQPPFVTRASRSCPRQRSLHGPGRDRGTALPPSGARRHRVQRVCAPWGWEQTNKQTAAPRSAVRGPSTTPAVRTPGPHDGLCTAAAADPVMFRAQSRQISSRPARGTALASSAKVRYERLLWPKPGADTTRPPGTVREAR